MTDKVLWFYRKNYYSTESEALNALLHDYPNAMFAQLLQLAENEIKKIYEGEIIELDKESE